MARRWFSWAVRMHVLINQSIGRLKRCDELENHRDAQGRMKKKKDKRRNDEAKPIKANHFSNSAKRGVCF